jgi:PGF-CTERM protein
MNGRVRRTGIVTVAVILLLFSVAGSVTGVATHALEDRQAQTGDVSPPAFVVTVYENGSADVAVTYTFNLTDEGRQAAFQQLRDSETARQGFEDRFRQQLQTVASDAGNATGREMAVTAVDVGLETSGETGVVTVTASWEGLAATDGDSLTVTEPFASGFAPDRPFVVVHGGATVESVSPEPDDRTDERLTWATNSDLSGFELVVTPPEDGTATPADGDTTTDEGKATSDGDGQTGNTTPGGGGPGFGVVVGLLALGGGVLATRRR